MLRNTLLILGGLLLLGGGLLFWRRRDVKRWLSKRKEAKRGKEA